MAIFWTNFSEYTLGAAPSDWADQWTATATRIVENDVLGPGGRRLRLNVGASNGRRAYRWTTPGVISSNCEVLTLLSIASDPATDIVVAGPILHLSGGAGSESGYYCTVLETTNAKVNFTGGGYSNGIALPQDPSTFNWNASTLYYQRIRIDGAGTVKIKIWAYGSAEPAGWRTAGFTRTDRTSGYAGMFAFAGNVNTHVYFFSVATGGDTAPLADEVESGGTTHDRDAAVTSASTFTASAVRTLRRAADISGVSSFIASGAVARQYSRDAAIASASSFAAAGTVTRARAALMAGVSTFAAAARLERSRSVVVAGASAFIAQGAVTRSRSAEFAGTSAFTAAGEVAGQIPRSASFASQSSFGAERVVTYSRSAAFAAVSAFTATQDAPSGLQRGGFMPRRRPFVYQESTPEEEPVKKPRPVKTVKKRITVAKVEKALETIEGIPEWWMPEPEAAKAALPEYVRLPRDRDGEAALIVAIQQMLINKAREAEDEEDVMLLLMAA